MTVGNHKQQVLLSRSLEHASSFLTLHESGDFYVEGVPLITFDYVEPVNSVSTEEQIKEHDWLVITSHNGIYYFFEWLQQMNISSQILNTLRIVTVGEKTRQTLASYGFEVDFIPDVYDADSLVHELIHTYKAQYPLLIKGTKSRAVIDEALSHDHIPFRSLVVYKTVTNWSEQERIQCLMETTTFDAFVFTSPSTIDAFLDMVGPLQGNWTSTPCFAIGKTTANYAETVGFERVKLPNTYTLEGLAEAIQYFFKE
ncbi:uroporphyrinogen-III synthase [Alkalibacillus sp. S2W]|uniref:uroporphyrinogen-III synthase n=1 Tax=Alkalibacillus sp. S2W TaxID=3386553 RepID=UPI00398D1E23